PPRRRTPFPGAQFGPRRLALGLAFDALAADRLQILPEIIGAVVVGDLLAGLNLLGGADVDLLQPGVDVGFGIRPAGMVGVARDIAADRTVDGPAAVQFEQIFVLDRVIFRLRAIEQRPEILEDPGALFDLFRCEEPEAGPRPSDTIR